MPHVKVSYSSTHEPWLEVWLGCFVTTRQGVPVTRQEMILSALRKQAEADLAKILSFDQMRVLFYPDCIHRVDLEKLEVTGNHPSLPSDYLERCGFPQLLTMHELVGFVAGYSKANPKCIYDTLKTVGRSKVKQIRLQFASWSTPAYYHPVDKSRDTWQLQGLT